MSTWGHLDPSGRRSSQFVSAFPFLLILFSFEKVTLYSKHIGKTPEKIEEDIRHPKYFSPSEAVEYGIIDKVTIQ
ncbi:ATP-dependent Clp protease proteolytic subunit [Musa troglodytarum]|uniref:ATP-dependent Clp protease proteolytic subunit n=1 Tax=Musa troglodytarum TaxID=320322 RepID=A0A9E7EQN2_9LILI|nr:ATP-dependent Clp protease proteolytic subunit [Musa troglodytarum]